MERLCGRFPSAQGSERRTKRKRCLWTLHLYSWLGQRSSGHLRLVQ
jgi:hypothetical protein